MYLTITKNLEDIRIYNGIDNNSGRLYIGLCEISYSAKLINISAKLYNNKMRLDNEHREIPEGYYNFHTFANKIFKPLNITAKINPETLLVTLIIPTTVKVLAMSMNLATMLGFENNRFNAGTYTGENPIKRVDLYLHLNELNTTENLLNGTPSSVLEIIPTGRFSKEYTTPRFKQLSKGFFENLNLSIKNEIGELVQFNDLCIVLKILAL